MNIFLENLDSIVKNRDMILMTKVCIVSTVFPVARVQMLELDHKEGWSTKELMLVNCGVRRRLFEHPLTAKRSNQLQLKGNQS